MTRKLLLFHFGADGLTHHSNYPPMTIPMQQRRRRRINDETHCSHFSGTLSVSFVNVPWLLLFRPCCSIRICVVSVSARGITSAGGLLSRSCCVLGGGSSHEKHLEINCPSFVVIHLYHSYITWALNRAKK